MSEEMKKEMAVTPVGENGLAKDGFFNVDPTKPNRFFSSIQQDGTRETSVRIYNAMNNRTAALSDMIGQTIEVQDVILHDVQLVTEDGELQNAVRTVLVTPDGKTYDSVAAGVVSSLHKIFGLVGPAPWKPALKVVPMENRTRRGYKTLVLNLQA